MCLTSCRYTIIVPFAPEIKGRLFIYILIFYHLYVLQKSEFAKLCTFDPYVPSCLTCLTHAPDLRALSAFFKCLSHLICAP